MNKKFRPGRHHRVVYYMGRRHVVFLGQTMRTMRVWQWEESPECYRVSYDNAAFFSRQ